jgi:hypothetical protein
MKGGWIVIFSSVLNLFIYWYSQDKHSVFLKIGVNNYSSV